MFPWDGHLSSLERCSGSLSAFLHSIPDKQQPSDNTYNYTYNYNIDNITELQSMSLIISTTRTHSSHCETRYCSALGLGKNFQSFNFQFFFLPQNCWSSQKVKLGISHTHQDCPFNFTLLVLNQTLVLYVTTWSLGFSSSESVSNYSIISMYCRFPKHLSRVVIIVQSFQKMHPTVHSNSKSLFCYRLWYMCVKTQNLYSVIFLKRQTYEFRGVAVIPCFSKSK